MSASHVRLSPVVLLLAALAFTLPFVSGCPFLLPPDQTQDDGQGAADDAGQGSQTQPGDNSGGGDTGGGADDAGDDDGGGDDGGAGADDGGTEAGDGGTGAGDDGADDDGADDNAGDDDDGDQTQAVAPLIGSIGDTQFAVAGQPYVGPRPTLLQGTPPITWTLEVGPAGMTISSAGVVRWNSPTEGLYPVVIAARGPGGADTEGWTLVVEPAEPQVPEVIVERISVAVGDPSWANDESESATVSADGRFVAFSSQASNLVAGDLDIDRDVFVRDRSTGQTTRVTLGYDGTEPDGASLNPVISADGRYVAFQSSASNLVPNDSNGASDVFVWDRLTGAITRVSISSAGQQGDAGSQAPAISADGRFVAFESVAANLVDGDANARGDVFVHDRDADGNGVFDEEGKRQTVRVSVGSGGQEAQGDAPGPFLSFDAAISADGRYIAFASYAANLVADDLNGVADIFLHDRDPDGNGVFDEGNATTVRVSRGADGLETDGDSRNPHISGSDARFIVFESEATTICACDVNGQADVYLFDGVSGATVAVSVRTDGETGTGASAGPVVSADGRYVVFHSSAPDLVEADANGALDVFVRDLLVGTTVVRSVSRGGQQGNGDSLAPFITPDGRYVVFQSKATNLTEDPDYGTWTDVFIRSLSE